MKESATSLKQILLKPCSTCRSGKVNFCQSPQGTTGGGKKNHKQQTTTKTPPRFEGAHHSSSLFLWVLFFHFLMLSFSFLNIFNLQVSQFLLKTAKSLGEEFPCILTDKMASAKRPMPAAKAEGQFNVHQAISFLALHKSIQAGPSGQNHPPEICRGFLQNWAEAPQLKMKMFWSCKVLQALTGKIGRESMPASATHSSETVPQAKVGQQSYRFIQQILRKQEAVRAGTCVSNQVVTHQS